MPCSPQPLIFFASTTHLPPYFADTQNEIFMKRCVFLLVISMTCTAGWLSAQPATQTKYLLSKAKTLQQCADSSRLLAYQLAASKHWDTVLNSSDGYGRLVGVNRFGLPVYYHTYNNRDAAATIGTSQLWPGGKTGLNLSGNSALMKNRLAIWDGGRILDTHVELAGRIKRMDSSYYSGGGSDHGTHVAGTMIASGVNPLVKGMAYEAQNLLTYDFSNDVSEMSNAAANGLLLSNHSYGDIAGWYKNPFTGRWEFWGRYNENEDYNFGYYDANTSVYDELAYNAPYYLIVKAAGNNRNVNGPAVGQSYDRYDSTGVMSDAGVRPAGISSNNGYGIIGTTGNAKNVLTVGAVLPIINGYTKPSDVVMSAFSSWGPTDDGRIKPDLVADGVNVLSCIASGATDYISESGTSMSAPGITGSLLLWQEYYASLHGANTMRSATLKALAIHTADEAGTTKGPDYQFGWGLLNSTKAVEVIKTAAIANNNWWAKHLLIEDKLTNGQVFTQTIPIQKTGSLKATIAWTDPAGTVDFVDVLNNPTPKLVNDLDIRLTKGGKTYYPWILTPTVPSAAATKGDNLLDNVEQIILDTVYAGDIITLEIKHKGSLQNGLPQAFSLALTQPTDTTLPLKLLRFTAKAAETHIHLQWLTIQETQVKQYEIEHAAVGTNDWQTIAILSAKNNSMATQQYDYQHRTRLDLAHQYRLKMMDNDGRFTYSGKQRVLPILEKISLLVTPNPATTNALVQLNGYAGKARLQVLNAKGQPISTRLIKQTNGASWSIITDGLSKGNYQLIATTSEGVVMQQQMMVP